MYLCQTSDSGTIFLPQSYNQNNLGKGLLDEAKHQISKAWTFWFQEENFIRVYVKLVALGARLFFIPGL